MAAKFFVFSLLVASAYCSGGSSSFSYGVTDPHTGDIKDQHEKREGDNVVGKYSLIESDGTKRIVEYQANPATGFNAIVRKEPAPGFQAPASFGHGAVASSAWPNSALPYSNPAGNLGYSGYAGANNFNSPQGVSKVSHYSNSVVHNVPRAYPGPYAGAHGAGISSGTAYGSAYGTGLNAGAAYGNTFGAGPNAGAAYGAGSYAGGPYNGAYGLAGPQGVPAVSHYSHSVSHDAARPYSGPYASVGSYGAHGNHGAFSGPLAHGYGAQFAGSHGYSGAHNSLSRGEAYPHGYGGYGARTHGAGFGAGLGAGFGAGVGHGQAW